MHTIQVLTMYTSSHMTYSLRISESLYRIYLYKHPKGDAFFKSGATVTDKKINSRVQWQWAIMDTYNLDLAYQHV